MEELGTAGEYFGTGRRQPRDLGDVFQGGSASGDFIPFVHVGAVPPHGTGPGKLPEHNCQTYNGEAAKATRGRGMELPTAGDSDGGGAF